MSLRKFFPVRACIFDVDGLLINSEDIYTEIYNHILHLYGKPDLPWSIKALQQSRGHKGTLRILKWAQLPISLEEWTSQVHAQHSLFTKCKLLPGVFELLYNLSTCTTTPDVYLALASSAGKSLFSIKTAILPPVITDAIPEYHRVFGDDPSMVNRSGKPAPDIFLQALDQINQNLGLSKGEQPVTPEECLVFEDSIAGVEAGRRAGMQVAWVPHQGLLEVCRGREEMVLMGVTTSESDDFGSGSGSEGHRGADKEQQHNGSKVEDLPRESEDGGVQLLLSLEDFPYERYGICVDHSRTESRKSGM